MKTDIQNGEIDLLVCWELRPNLLGRIDQIIKRTIEEETMGRIQVSSVDVKLVKERDLTELVKGHCRIGGYNEYGEGLYKHWEGNFTIEGYRSSNTPIRLDKLHLVAELSTV